MPYDPTINTASRAVLGQGAANMPLLSNAVKTPNPAMTSPMAGPAMGSNPFAPGVGAPQGSVALGGPQPPGAFAGSPNTNLNPMAMQDLSKQGASPLQGAFGPVAGGAPNAVSMQRSGGTVAPMSGGRGAFGGGR